MTALNVIARACIRPEAISSFLQEECFVAYPVPRPLPLAPPRPCNEQRARNDNCPSRLAGLYRCTLALQQHAADQFGLLARLDALDLQLPCREFVPHSSSPVRHPLEQ